MNKVYNHCINKVTVIFQIVAYKQRTLSKLHTQYKQKLMGAQIQWGAVVVTYYRTIHYVCGLVAQVGTSY